MNRQQRRASLKVLQRSLDEVTRSRRCGGCTACCTVLEIRELAKPAGLLCVMACETGCKVYDVRPSVCREYLCGWKIGMGSEEQRPDKLGIVLSSVPSYSALHPGFVAHELRPGALDSAEVLQLLESMARTFTVALIRGEKPLRLLTPEDRRDAIPAMRAEIFEGR